MTAHGDDFSIGSLAHDRYRITGVLGRGGVATVYRADDELLGRTVALKVIGAQGLQTADRRRIEDEVRLIAGFDHPALVTLFDLADDNSLVMQFVDGENLATRIARGPLSSVDTAAIGRDVATALAYVHSRGVVHRDVKPANILLPESGAQTAMLADFGIARIVDDAGLTATGTIVGTASYLSPEQARGDSVDAPSDVYSLGLALLEALTAERAFPGSAVEAVAARLSRDPEIAPSVGDEWMPLLTAMLAREPGARPAAADVSAQLGDIADGAAATKVLPSAPTEVLQPEVVTEALASAAATAVLTPGVATEALVHPPVPAPAPRARRALPRRAGVIAVAIAAAVVIAIVATALLTRQGLPTAAPESPSSPVAETPSSTPTLEPISYPEITGKLGDRLRALQSAVSDRALQEQVLAITTLVTNGDNQGALAALGSLRTAVDDAELSASEREAIATAIDGVDKELSTLVKHDDKPGKND